MNVLRQNRTKIHTKTHQIPPFQKIVPIMRAATILLFLYANSNFEFIILSKYTLKRQTLLKIYSKLRKTALFQKAFPWEYDP